MKDPTIRTKPRKQETISVGGRTKWRLDALCAAGRRSRTATIALLLDHYLAAHPAIRHWVEDRATDPKPIQLKRRPSDSESDQVGA